MADDPKPNLETFQLTDLAGFTREGVFASNASADFHLFYVGRDDVHGILTYLWSRVTVSAYLNMFGYDDDELNDLVMKAAEDPHCTAVYTLDKSQSGGKHEKAILDSDMAKDPQAYKAHFAIGQSATHQISTRTAACSTGESASRRLPELERHRRGPIRSRPDTKSMQEPSCRCRGVTTTSSADPPPPPHFLPRSDRRCHWGEEAVGSDRRRSRLAQCRM